MNIFNKIGRQQNFSIAGQKLRLSKTKRTMFKFYFDALLKEDTLFLSGVAIAPNTFYQLRY